MTTKEVARFAALAGVTLPLGWRTFMARHGPGQLGGYVNLRGMAKRRGTAMTLADLLEVYRDNLDTYEDQYARGRASEVARLHRLVPFADSIGGDVLAWDPGKKPSEDEDVEYPVLLLPQGRKKLVEIASGFDDLVEVASRQGSVSSSAPPTGAPSASSFPDERGQRSSFARRKASGRSSPSRRPRPARPRFPRSAPRPTMTIGTSSAANSART